MSGELRRPSDPLLRELLASAHDDEPPDGAEEAMLAALGLGAAGTTAAIAATKSTASLGSTVSAASSLTKVIPIAAKLIGVVGVVGLGAVAWHQQHLPAASPSHRSEPPSRSRTSSPPPPSQGLAPTPVVDTESLLAPIEAATSSARVPSAPVAAAAHSQPRATPEVPEPAAVGASLEQETRLLTAARAALSRGDESAARSYLDRYEREVQGGTLRREAELLRERAGLPTEDRAR